MGRVLLIERLEWVKKKKKFLRRKRKMRMTCGEWPPATELWLFRREESYAKAVGTVEMGQGRLLF